FAYPASEAFTGGQTIGKKALSIRVITADGGPIRFRHGVIRSLIGFFEFLIVPGGAVALISTLFTRRTQRVGDLVAETVVVREKNDPTYPLFFNPPPGAEQVALSLDTTRLTHPQYGLLREFLVRGWEMTPEARQKVATDLSDRLFNLGIRRPSSVPAETFVSAVAFAHQRRFAGIGGSVGLAPSNTPPHMPPPGRWSGASSAPTGRPVNLPPPPVRVPTSGATEMNHTRIPGPPRA
ncbi:MAG: RDD family protein, partial [Acidimicrobiales bacterium]|nr:RDD family protein [Acidimicrobiales bacterium]